MGCVSSRTIPLEDIEGYQKDARLQPQKSGVRSESNAKALKAIFTSRGCDHLVDATTNSKAKFDRLRGTPFGVLFSAQGVPGVRAFLRDHLIPLYTALQEAGQSFEIVYVGNDANVESWHRGLQGMPWLAVPFSLSSTGVGDSMGVFFGVQELPTLVIVDRSGAVVTTQGVRLVKQMGTKAWPFSPEHVAALGWRPKESDEESECSQA